VRAVFQGDVPSQIEKRVDFISNDKEWEAGVDPFEEAQRRFDESRYQIDEAMNRVLAI
jgi:hypothetical protein